MASIGPVLLCDGSREGLLTALFHAEALRPQADGILLEPPMQLSFDAPNRIETNAEYALRVWTAIEQKLPEEAAWTFEMLYVSDREDRGTLLMRYLRVGWELGMRLEQAVNHPDVFAAIRLRKRVGYEIHKLTGLTRFAKMQDSIYYASLEPDHDIVSFLADHFQDRLADQRFVIHDVRRCKAALYRPEQGRYVVMPMQPPSQDPRLQDMEFIQLWKTYFHTIAIQERINPKLQRQHMPTRYWKHLHEMF